MGILVRKMDVYGIGNSLRITIGKDDENKKLINVLKSFKCLIKSQSLVAG